MATHEGDVINDSSKELDEYMIRRPENHDDCARFYGC